MDSVYHSETVITATGAAAAAHSPQAPLAILHFSLPFLAVAVWFVEHWCRARPGSDIAIGQRFFRQLVPEMIGLLVVSCLAVVLLVCHRHDQSLAEDQAWNSVNKEWPLLMTADSLIGFQAMIRVVFLSSATIRRSAVHLSPLDGEPAAFFLLASVARVSLLFLSPRDSYHLDGPLGGDFNVAMEVTALLLLLPLGSRLLLKGNIRIGSFITAVMLFCDVASRHHFALADQGQTHLDQLFSLVLLLEFGAGIAFYIRSARGKGRNTADAFSGFAHFILPVQQALPTYFILVAFAAPFKVEPSLVGRGRPFEVMQAGSLMQVVMYALCALLYSASCAEEKHVSTYAAPIPAAEIPPAEECSICLGSCEACDDAEGVKPRWRKLNCGHHFHEQCIFEWLKKAQKCPMCRRHVCEKGGVKWAPPMASAEAATAVTQ